VPKRDEFFATVDDPKKKQLFFGILYWRYSPCLNSC